MGPVIPSDREEGVDEVVHHRSEGVAVGLAAGKVVFVEASWASLCIAFWQAR